jgi:hypothetical protein
MSYKNLRLTKTKIAVGGFGLALALQAFVPFLSLSASAGNLTNTLVRVDRLAQSQSTGGMVCAKPTTASTEAHVQVTFPGSGTQGSNSFGVNSTASNWTTTTTNLPSGATAWLGIGTATNVSGATVTFPSSDLVVGTLYCFNFASASTLSTPTNNGTNLTGSVTTQDSVPSTIDSGAWAVTIVGAGADQVTVSATVNPAFSMSLSTTTDGLGTLTTGSVATSGSAIQATVSTNAANGWYLWGKDSQAGLHSTNATYTIASNCSSGAGTNTTLSAGTEGYNLGATVGAQGSGSGGTAATSGTGLVFDNAGGTAGKGAGLCSTNYQTIANSNGTANAARIDMKNNAAISGVTKPGTDYTDLETFVGAGLF